VVLNWLWQRDGGDVKWEGVGRRMDINAATNSRFQQTLLPDRL